MLKVVEIFPVASTVTSVVVDGAGPQLTGIVSFNAVNVTVG